MNDFERRCATHEKELLQSRQLDILQVNIGFRCNQSCSHCHLSSSPERQESMDRTTMEKIIEAARASGVSLVDITGGAPEINSHFRDFVTALRNEAIDVQVRTNLTIMCEPGYEDLPSFLTEHHVKLVASMPCYLEENVNGQRGARVYEKSIHSLRELNSRGYGVDDSLPLDLVYNPAGPFLPPNQTELETAYKKELDERFGIRFNNLLTITNMPMGRFLGRLKREKKEREYAELLVRSFNPATLDGLMCRYQLSIGWDGTMYDCDFNLALDMPIQSELPPNVRDFDPDVHAKRKIVTGFHCFGCTAGSGSSCGGALAS